MRKISMFMMATVFLLLSSIQAQTTLNPGDLVIVTANADGTDNFDFIPLVDIQAGTVIKFTDNAWTTADTLRTNEGTLTWTASADVTKGTVVSFTGATAGDWVEGSGFDLAAAGDNILVYQGDATTPSFIYGIGWAKANNWIWTGNNDSDIPDALSVASKTIVQLANFDDNQYNGSTSGTAAQLLAMVAYAPYWVGNDVTAYTAYPNAFTITATATCTAPYALTATGITASSANLGWSTFGTEVLWNVEYGVTGFVQGAGTTVSGVTNPYTLNGLNQNTTYQYYVQADCGGSTSTWVGPFSITTPYSCPKPTLPTVANITATSAVLGWTNGGTETAWIVYYKTAAATDYTEVTGVTTNPYTLNGLTAATSYIFKVKANCSVSDTSFTSATQTFTTPCNAVSTLPWVESFETGYVDATTIAGCWSQISVAGTSPWKANSTSTTYNRTPRTGSYNATLYYSNEDWLFYSFNLTAGTSYTFEMYARQDGSTTTNANLTVAYGANANVASMTNPIIASTGLTSGNYQLLSGAFTPATTGVYYIGIKGFINSAPYYISIDDIKLDLTPSCVAPTALTATSITASGATLGWTAGGTETLWNVEYGVTGFVQGAGTTVTGVTNPYTVGGLTQNTTYQYYVKSDCGGSGTSTWAGPFSFTTPYSCPKPTLPTATNVTTTSADLGWTAGGTETAWILYYKTAAATDYTEVTGVTTNPYTLNGLTAATSYIFKVKANCSVSDTSFVSTTKTFTTLCNAEVAPTLVQDFATYTGNAPQPICWSEATGVLGATTTLTYANSEWNSSTGFANSGTNVGVKTNLYSTGNEWLISQPIDLGATAGLYRVSYKYAVTSYNATVSQATLGTHKVNVVVSTDGGATWSNTNSIKEYTGAASYSNTGVTETINLTGYSGVVKIAFVATTNATTPDIDFHIDDFKVEAIPSCVAPTALSATSITASGATLGWTAGGTETAWNVEYGVTGFTQGTGTVAPATANSLALTTLAAATTYQFYVQANCGGAGTSTWAGPFSFTTPCAAVSTLPWVEGFETGYTNAATVAGCWSQVSTTGSATWMANSTATTYNRTPRTGAFNATLYYGNEDWLFYQFSLTAGTSYTFEMYARQDGSTTTNANITVSYGANADVASMTNPIIASTGLTNGTYQLLSGAFTPATSGIYYIGIKGFINSTPWYISLDDIKLDITPACVAPTALNATSITAAGATLGWTAGGTETTWNVEYGVTGFTQGTGTIANGVANAYAITGLTQNTTYQFYVQSDCGGSGTSTWSGPYSFTTAYSCPKPTLPVVSNITSASADLAWTAGGTETSWIVYYKTAAATNFTEVLNVTTNPYTLSGLASGTNYIFKVKANCSVSDTSVMSNTQTFATTCAAITALPYVEPFATYLPSVCWLEGDAGDLTAGPTTISATASSWGADGFLNNGSTGAAKINVYQALLNDWLISPEITIPATPVHRLKYSVGATEFGDVIAPAEAWESDDVVQVLVTTSYPTNWTVLKTFDNTNVPSYLGQDDMIDLSAYAGQTVRIAYRALEGTTNGAADIDFFVDNFTVEAVPSCEAPLSLTANAVTSNSADVAFTSAAPNFNVRYRLAGATTWTTTTATASPVSISGLTHSSEYEVQIMAFCSASDSSVWSSVLNFSTLCGVYQVPFLQDFNVAPNCWTLSSDTLNSSIDLSGTTSSWGLASYLNIASGQLAARLNIYGSSVKSWLLSPEINLGTGANQLEFDLAATEYNDITDASGTREDDKFAVVISTDGGITWSQANVLRQWDNTGSTYVYNNINATPQHITIDLSAYTGIVKIAFYGESFVTANGDNDLFVDNVAVNPILVPCATPTALAATNIAQTTADLGWTSTAANFNVRYRTVGATSWTDATASTTTLALTLLTANTQYEFQVQAVCSATAGDTSAWATAVNFTTLATPACATPTALAATNIAQTTADLGWTSTAANFNVRYRTVGASTWTNSTASTTTLALTSLTANTQYEFQVQAVCSATAGDTSAWATAVNFTTLDNTPTCNAPTALVVSAINAAGASLSWTNGGTETAWNIRYKKVVDATYTNVNNTTTKPYVLTGLQANTAYVWNVQAICSASLNSAWSADNTFTTTVGVEENSLNGLSVYSYNKQVNVINNGNILVKAVVIYDMLGQEVGTYAINSTDNVLINSDLTIGNYVVKVITETKVSNYKLFIK